MRFWSVCHLLKFCFSAFDIELKSKPKHFYSPILLLTKLLLDWLSIQHHGSHLVLYYQYCTICYCTFFEKRELTGPSQDRIIFIHYKLNHNFKMLQGWRQKKSLFFYKKEIKCPSLQDIRICRKSFFILFNNSELLPWNRYSQVHAPGQDIIRQTEKFFFRDQTVMYSERSWRFLLLFPLYTNTLSSFPECHMSTF